jgi:hypothetical protein
MSALSATTRKSLNPPSTTTNTTSTKHKRAAFLKQRRSSSTGPITQYEAQRISEHRSTYGKQGRLRTFWRRVQKHQNEKLQHLEHLASFIRERAHIQKNFAISIIKLTEGTSLQPVIKPTFALDMSCNELLKSEVVTATWITKCADTIMKDVCIKGLDVLSTDFKSACSHFGRRAFRVSKKIDESHAQVLKCHRNYQTTFQNINQHLGSAATAASAAKLQENNEIEAAALNAHAKVREASGGASVSCLWTVETMYTRSCTVYETCCREYRHEMSQLYLEYQKLELDRLTKIKNLIQLYLKNVHEGFQNVVNDSQFLNSLAASSELDPQKEVVLGLNSLNQKIQEDSSSSSGSSGGSTTKNDGYSANNNNNKGDAPSSPSTSTKAKHVAPPPPLQSRLVLKSGTLLMKTGLLRSWKPHHAVLTADGYLHLFDPSSLLESGSSDGGGGGRDGGVSSENNKKALGTTPPTYEPSLTVDVIASIAKASPSSHPAAFEITTNTKGFLGIMNSTRTQILRSERKDLVNPWVDAFGRIRRLISSEITSSTKNTSRR